MRILVNYDPKEQNFLSVLQFFLRQKKLEAIATNATLSIGELIAKAQVAKCQAIFCCNESTLQNLVPNDKATLDNYRGSVLKFSIPCLIGNSLAHTQTIEYGSWLLSRDLDKLFRLGEKVPPFEFSVLQTTELQEEAYTFLSNSVLIAYDIETKTIDTPEDSIEVSDTIITCCSWAGLGKDGSIKTFVLPLVDFLEDHWKTDYSYKAALLLMRRINALDIPKVMHNGMYDALHSIIYRAEPNNWTLDTMAMAWCEFTSLPKTLDFVASLTLLDYIQWKDEAAASSKSKDIARYWAYNAKDSFTTLRICMFYLNNLPAYAKKNYSIQFKFVYPFLYCAFEGILINNNTRLALKAQAEAKQVKALQSLRTCLADPLFNPSSPKQVKNYIYDVFGAVSPGIGTKLDSATGKKVKVVQGTSEKNLLTVGEQHPLLLRLTTAIIEYREAQKAIGTYFTFLQKNSRLLYSIDPFGTETGRASARSSSLWCGTQIQNVPKYAKGMLVADEGFTLIEIDNKQSEGFCTAFLSGDEQMIASLSDRTKDFYTTLGTLFFGIPYEQVTKEFRNKVLKRINHGASYRMGAATFVSNVDKKDLIFGAATLGIKITMAKIPKAGEMTLKEFAQLCLDKFHAPFPKVKEWYADIKLRIVTTGRLVSPLGFTRIFFNSDKLTYTQQTAAIAHEPQNLSVSILNIGLWRIWGLVKESNGDFRLKAQIHDSVLAQFRTSKPELAEEMNNRLQNPVKIGKRTLLIPTDAKTGQTWKEEN